MAAVCAAAVRNLGVDGASVTVMSTLLVGEPLFASMPRPTAVVAIPFVQADER